MGGLRRQPGQDAMIRLRHDAVAWQEVDGQLILLDTRSSRYLGVNHTGATLWPQIVDGATVEELTTLLATSTRLALTAARADVEAFVAHLTSLDMITTSS